MIDTAVVARMVVPRLLGPDLLAELRAAFAPLGDPAGWVAFLCGLHDLGKYSPGFQAIDVEAAAQRLGESAADDLRFVAPVRGVRRKDTPHGLVTALHMRPLLESWGVEQTTAEEIAVALGGHHGFFPSSAAIRQARAEKNNHGMGKWHGWRDGLVEALAEALELPVPSVMPWHRVRIGIGATIGLAGVTTVSDWIASDELLFSSPIGSTDLGSYARRAKDTADVAVARLGLGGWTPPADTSFAGLFPEVAPRPVQLVVEQISAGRAGPTMTVVEAPTGEGKSYAGLQVSVSRVRGLGLAGMYVGMPTRAMSNQVHREMENLVARHGGGTSVRLIHANARADQMLSPTDIGPDSGDSDVGTQEWFIRKKSLLTDLGVGTVDQALKAVIRSGHFFVRLVALSNKVVVFDEVHSYSLYMSTLLDRLLMWLGRLGISVVLLSATLPARRRTELVSSWQAGLLRCRTTEIGPLPESAAYPRVTVADREGVAVSGAGVSMLNADRPVWLEHVADEDVVDWVMGKVRDGGCVAVVHNLVARVKATFGAVAERVRELPNAEQPHLVVLTGQLTEGVRRDRENWLREAFGPGGTRPSAVVIGTQVLEHGLDLDFDAMVSDAAPIDLLIQRAGRVVRHDRRGRAEIVLGITGVEDSAAGPVFPRYLHAVYERVILLRTWAVLRDRAMLRCPDDVPSLVDAVYGPREAVACPSGWEKAWHAAEESATRRSEREAHAARTFYLPAPHAVVGVRKLSEQPKSARSTRNGRPSR